VDFVSHYFGRYGADPNNSTANDLLRFYPRREWFGAEDTRSYGAEHNKWFAQGMQDADKYYTYQEYLQQFLARYPIPYSSSYESAGQIDKTHIPSPIFTGRKKLEEILPNEQLQNVHDSNVSTVAPLYDFT
jgi:hypothetical protein